MRKKDELAREHTCMSHAHPSEMVFVLLGRDAAAPHAINAWAAERLRLGKNALQDPQIQEALACARTMTEEGRKWVDAPIVEEVIENPLTVIMRQREMIDGLVRRANAAETRADALAASNKTLSQRVDWADRLRDDRALLERHLKNLLARVHRDGGHYTERYGLQKAVDDADEVVAQLLLLRDTASARGE
jgi:hypothetical protein